MQHDKQVSIPYRDAERRTGRVFIDCFGSGEYEIDVRGKMIRFEWSEQFGPMPINKDGSEALSIGPKHGFWRAASLWKLQGMSLEGNKAIWHEPKKPVTEKWGRHHFIVEHGEPGWDW